jgi:hypothetical protein
MNDITPATPGNGATKPADRRVRHGLIEDWRDGVGILVLLLVAAFFGALLARFWPDSEDGATHLTAEVGSRLTAIEGRLAQEKGTDFAALKDRVSKIETRLRNAEIAMTASSVASGLAATAFGAPGAGPTPGSAIPVPATADAARKLIDDLGTRLTALEGKVGTAPDDVKAAQTSIGTLTTSVTDLGTKIDTFSDRLARIENSDLLEMARRASLASAIANLMRASQGSAPFKTEFDVVAALSPDDKRLAEIAPLAAKGLPTAGTLLGSFGNLADRAMDLERIAKSEGMWDRWWANFTSLISSRKIGETGDNSTEGRLARAEVRMKAGDLGAAVRELNAIQGAAREPLKPWLTDASARMRLESVLADLNTRAIQALSGPTATTSSEPVPQLPEQP